MNPVRDDTNKALQYKHLSSVLTDLINGLDTRLRGYDKSFRTASSAGMTKRFRTASSAGMTKRFRTSSYAGMTGLMSSTQIPQIKHTERKDISLTSLFICVICEICAHYCLVISHYCAIVAA
ncbi:MAG: hypothetical protein RBS43_00135 [Candidatus Cloacimonas sp.]|nr:hypothetical protein [Candidatus Cloacimonas sp.]